MLKISTDLPSDVLGIEVSGKLAHQDYRDVLIPAIEAQLAKGPVKVLCVLEPDFKGFEMEALWDDASFGTKHWRDFGRMALVTDSGAIRGATAMFASLYPAEIKLFKRAELPAAKDWISKAN